MATGISMPVARAGRKPHACHYPRLASRRTPFGPEFVRNLLESSAMAVMIGLTGGIGSGKSTVAGYLAERGAHVIDADRVAHDVYAPGTLGYERIVERFGDDVVGEDGAIDRAELGALVFRDPAALAELNAIVHPLVRAEVAARVADIVSDDPTAIVVIEAALMTETGWSGGAGRLWTVIAEPDVVEERLVATRDMDPDEVQRRMAAQADNDARRRSASRVIENNGSLLDLEAEVQSAWAELREELETSGANAR
ncbi:MAG: dephospho-CoA kinase [Candidatus Binatia bacterium]